MNYSSLLIHFCAKHSFRPRRRPFKKRVFISAMDCYLASDRQLRRRPIQNSELVAVLGTARAATSGGGGPLVGALPTAGSKQDVKQPLKPAF